MIKLIAAWESLLPIAVLYTVLLGLWFSMGERLGRLGFFVVFAIAVTALVQIVGIYLVFASLIIPALATRSMTRRTRLLVGYAIGATSFLGGIVVSAVLDLPTGAVIVWTMAAISRVAGLISSRMGDDLLLNTD
jgi:zinc/manganese transport system permease protein